MGILLKILKIIAAAGTVGTGLIALIKPRSIYDFTGLRADSERGITEIRAIFGGMFIALGGAVLYYQTAETYRVLGITYLGIAVVRLISLFIDDSIERSNIISLIIEVLFGVILILP
jgi:hypothetical protein